VLFVLKINDSFGKEKVSTKELKDVIFFIYSIDYFASNKSYVTKKNPI
jgi:hypothetical protein